MKNPTRSLALGILALVLLSGVVHAQVPSTNDTSDQFNNTGMGTNALGGGINSACQIGQSISSKCYNTAAGYAALGSIAVGGNYNTGFGFVALYQNATGFYNTASGAGALEQNTTGNSNTAIGFGALSSNILGDNFTNSTGSFNTASGSQSLYLNTTGGNNTATGYRALYKSTTGNNNTGSGFSALYNATTGVRNVALGYQAGFAVTTGSDNIIIGANSQGLAADSGVIRIGNKTYQKKAFIAGIQGVKTGLAAASTVFVDANGQLGTIKSSRRYKEDIQTMGGVSEKLFGLRPVTFRYTQPFDDGSKPVQYGLIAEEVAEVMPELVVYGEDGKPETVSYHLLATLLLNEVQKDHRVIQAQADQLLALQRDHDSQAIRMAALEQQVAVLAKAADRAEKNRMVASTK